jgi:hypothetical protein
MPGFVDYEYYIGSLSTTVDRIGTQGLCKGSDGIGRSCRQMVVPGPIHSGSMPVWCSEFVSLCFEFTVQECLDVLTKKLEAAAPQNHHNDNDDDDDAGTALLFWDTC